MTSKEGVRMSSADEPTLCAMRYFLTCVVVVGTTSTACADWQYTKWGMTPQEVGAASNGAAKCEHVEPHSKGEEDLDFVECSGRYVTGKFSFIVTFGFDRFHHLRTVALISTGNELGKTGASVEDVMAALQEKYGAWREGVTWIDGASNYSVSADVIGETIMIHYKPLHIEERGGL